MNEKCYKVDRNMAEVESIALGCLKEMLHGLNDCLLHLFLLAYLSDSLSYDMTTSWAVVANVVVAHWLEKNLCLWIELQNLLDLNPK